MPKENDNSPRLGGQPNSNLVPSLPFEHYVDEILALYSRDLGQIFGPDAEGKINFDVVSAIDVTDGAKGQLGAFVRKLFLEIYAGRVNFEGKWQQHKDHILGQIELSYINSCLWTGGKPLDESKKEVAQFVAAEIYAGNDLVLGHVAEDFEVVAGEIINSGIDEPLGWLIHQIYCSEVGFDQNDPRYENPQFRQLRSVAENYMAKMSQMSGVYGAIKERVTEAKKLQN